MREPLHAAASLLRQARALLVAAGAGMGVDSGLPDFRGSKGFWRAYPAFERLGLSFVELANPTWFQRDPELAWGFYGHRLNLYRATVPHAGFSILRSWGERIPDGAFVFTSNVDGQFQRAGFDPDRVVECHGSVHHLQCVAGCGAGTWPAEGVRVDVDEATMRARPPLPSCRSCGGLARPNVLMFGDWGWDDERTSAQEERLSDWMGARDGPLVVVECGAGTAVPTVRHLSERVLAEGGALVRVNPDEPQGPSGPRFVGVPMRSLAALSAIDALLAR